jgi:VanZ family protein
VAAVVYLAAVFVVSHIPGKLLDLGFDIWDKAIHFVEYVPLGFLLCGWVVRRAWAPRRRVWLVLVVTVAVLVLGALDEVHQLFVENRSATLGDAVADGLGGLVGGAVGALVFSARGSNR